MTRTYTLKNGKKLHCWYNSMGCIDIKNSEGITIRRIEVEPHNEDATFTYNKQRIRVGNYDYLTVKELITKAKNDAHAHGDENWGRYIRHDDFLTTLLKDTEHVGIVRELDYYSAIVPMMGIALKSSNGTRVRVMTIPFENDRYTKEHWCYKVPMKSQNETIAMLTGIDTMYFCDIHTSIRHGDFMLVDREEFAEEANRLDQEALNTKTSISIL